MMLMTMMSTVLEKTDVVNVTNDIMDDFANDVS